MNDTLQEGSNPLLNLASKILIATQGPIINALREKTKLLILMNLKNV